jgi:hypothetical protein
VLTTVQMQWNPTRCYVFIGGYHNWRLTWQIAFYQSVRMMASVTLLQLLITLGWVHTCNVTAYRNIVPWQCGRDSWPRNVSKVGYAVTLRACSVCCRYLAVASKGWYGYGLSRSVRATLRCTSRRCFYRIGYERRNAEVAGFIRVTPVFQVKEIPRRGSNLSPSLINKWFTDKKIPSIENNHP